MSELEEPAAYTLAQLRGYLKEFAPGEFGDLRVYREDEDGVAARVEVDSDEHLHHELTGAGFETEETPQAEHDFIVRSLTEPLDADYSRSLDGEWS